VNFPNLNIYVCQLQNVCLFTYQHVWINVCAMCLQIYSHVRTGLHDVITFLFHLCSL